DDIVAHGRRNADGDALVRPVLRLLEHAGDHLPCSELVSRDEAAALVQAVQQHLHVRAPDVHREDCGRLRLHRVPAFGLLSHEDPPPAASSARINAARASTRPAGIEWSPSRSLRSASTLSSPVTSHSTCFARARAGYVSVIRRRPWYSAVRATGRSVTSSTGSPGTSDAVWPSGPRPRWTRSNSSGRAEA